MDFQLLTSSTNFRKKIWNIFLYLKRNVANFESPCSYQKNPNKPKKEYINKLCACSLC